MAYSIDNNGDIVISGFNQGIGASPYSGLTDLRSVEIDSVPGEAAVNFATKTATGAVVIVNDTTNGSLATTSGGLFLAPTSSKLETFQYIMFSSIGTAAGTVAINKPYKLMFYGISVGGLQEYTMYDPVAATNATVTGASASVNFSTISPTKPKFFAEAGVANFMIDDSGRVWSSYQLTQAGGFVPTTNSWTWTGNTCNNIGVTSFSDAHGNGMVYWRTAHNGSVGDWDGWLLIFRDGEIDYCNVDGVISGAAYNHVGTYTYNWQPNGKYLTGANFPGCPHTAIVGPDGRVYFCDYFNVVKLGQADLVTPTTFVPATSSTYEYIVYDLLPINDVATCIAPLGNNYVIGGILNKAYQWDSTSNQVLNAILLAEAYVQNIVTVNTNAYIFAGNTGRIYVTNGSQANEFAKIPAHLSNTISPYFYWQGATYTRNKLYFSVAMSTNAGGTVNGYGGIWALTLGSTPAIYLSNQLSYGTYNGYASALMAIPPLYNPPGLPVQPAGIGMLIGWYDGGNSYGIDTTISTPYINGQSSWVTSDMIPVGTLLDPTTPLQIEYKLAQPLVAGESVQILTGKYLDMTYASFVSQFTSTSALISDNSANHGGMKDEQYQWMLVQAVLTSTATNPSYNRIVQLRIMGAGKKVTGYSTLP